MIVICEAIYIQEETIWSDVLGNWIKCSGKNFKLAWIMYMYIVSMFTFQTSQVQIQQQIVIQPSYPKSMKNKSIMCKPFLQTKATSCKPHTQTLGIQTGSTNSLILDCRVCLKRENCGVNITHSLQLSYFYVKRYTKANLSPTP